MVDTSGVGKADPVEVLLQYHQYRERGRDGLSANLKFVRTVCVAEGHIELFKTYGTVSMFSKIYQALVTLFLLQASPLMASLQCLQDGDDCLATYLYCFCAHWSKIRAIWN